jgi:hypothetical protein
VVEAVAEREIDAISAQNLELLVSFYADHVDLLDKGIVSNQTVRENLQQYFDRWPITKWKLAGRVDVKPLSASRYQVSFAVTFDVAIQLLIAESLALPTKPGLSRSTQRVRRRSCRSARKSLAAALREADLNLLPFNLKAIPCNAAGAGKDKSDKPGR